MIKKLTTIKVKGIRLINPQLLKIEIFNITNIIIENKAKRFAVQHQAKILSHFKISFIVFQFVLLYIPF